MLNKYWALSCRKADFSMIFRICQSLSLCLVSLRLCLSLCQIRRRQSVAESQPPTGATEWRKSRHHHRRSSVNCMLILSCWHHTKLHCFSTRGGLYGGNGGATTSTKSRRLVWFIVSKSHWWTRSDIADDITDGGRHMQFDLTCRLRIVTVMTSLD